MTPMQSQRGFNKPHGMALGLVFRAGNRCKSRGAPAGASPRPSRSRVGPGSGQTFAVLPPPPLPKKHKTRLTALEKRTFVLPTRYNQPSDPPTCSPIQRTNHIVGRPLGFTGTYLGVTSNVVPCAKGRDLPIYESATFERPSKCEIGGPEALCG